MHRAQAALRPLSGLGVLIAIALVLSQGVPGLDAAAAEGPADTTVSILPPAIVSVEDRPNDGGTGLDITWEASASESLVPGSVVEYTVMRSDAADGEFESVGTVLAGRMTFSDGDLTPNKPYWYRVVAVSVYGEVPSDISGPGYARMQWFNHDLVSVLVLTILICGLIIFSIVAARRRSGKMFLRRLPVFDAIDEAIGRATEMGKKVLYIMGQLDVDEPQTVASMNILARVADRTATYGCALDIPCVWPMAMSMARETVKESYLRAGKPDEYREDDIYYMTTDQFGYVAGVDGIMVRDRPAANFYLGAFYAESLVFAETGYATGAIQIAGTAEVDQLPFFVVACDYTLIGEELYAAGASLSADPVQIGSIRGQDIAKAIFIIMVIIGVILKLAGIDVLEQWLAIG